MFRRAPAPESLFNKVLPLQLAAILRKRPWRWFSLPNSAKFLRIIFHRAPPAIASNCWKDYINFFMTEVHIIYKPVY